MGTPNEQPFVPRSANEEELFENVIMSRLMISGIQNVFDYVYETYTQCDPNKRQIFEKGLRAVSDYCKPVDIFTACLRTYDLDFVRFTQLIYKHHPRLTSILMSTFADTTSVYEKCFRINNYLCDFRTAAIFYTMHYIELKDDPGDECCNSLISYAEANGQLEPVCDFLRGKGVCLAPLYVKCANYLAMGLNKVKAAEIYAELGEFQLALALYMEIYKWQEAMSIINVMSLSEDDKKIKLSELAVHLEDVSLFFGAATIYEILESNWHAARCFTLANSYSKAVRLADTVEPSMREYIKVALDKYVKELQQLFSGAKETVESLTARIQVIWHQRILENRNQNSGNSGKGTNTKKNVKTNNTETGQNFGNFNKERNTEENVQTSNTETSENSGNFNKERNTEENVKMSDTETGQNSENFNKERNTEENVKTSDTETGENSGNFNKERNTEENVKTSDTETSKNSENFNKEKNTEENIKMSDTQTGENSGNFNKEKNTEENVKTSDTETSQNSENFNKEKNTEENTKMSDTQTGQNSGNFNKERKTEENVTSNTENGENSGNFNKERNTEENVKTSDTETSQNSGNFRKQTNIKENIKTNDRKTRTGGPYEDIAIITTVYDEISKMTFMSAKLYDVVSTLHNFNDEHTATCIESAYYKMLRTFKICITKIWYAELNLAPQDVEEQLAAIRPNLHMIDEKYHFPPAIPEIPEQQDVEL